MPSSSNAKTTTATKRTINVDEITLRFLRELCYLFDELDTKIAQSSDQHPYLDGQIMGIARALATITKETM